MAWVAAVVAVVLVGVGGRLGGAEPGPSTGSSAAPVAGATPSPSTGGSVVVLLEPAPPPAAVTGIPLWVRGRAPAAATAVLLILREDGAELARQSARPGRTGRFAAVFTLLPPRPERHLTVTATALGEDITLGEAEQAVLVAPLDRVAAASSPRPRLGEDGVLGSRGVDLAGLRGGAPSPGGPALIDRWPSPPFGRLAEQIYR